MRQTLANLDNFYMTNYVLLQKCSTTILANNYHNGNASTAKIKECSCILDDLDYSFILLTILWASPEPRHWSWQLISQMRWYGFCVIDNFLLLAAFSVMAYYYRYLSTYLQIISITIYTLHCQVYLLIWIVHNVRMLNCGKQMAS